MIEYGYRKFIKEQPLHASYTYRSNRFKVLLIIEEMSLIRSDRLNKTALTFCGYGLKSGSSLT